MREGLLRFGFLLLGISVVTILVGLLALSTGSFLSWFGRLPGDIAFEREGLTVRIPLASSILISVVLTVLLNVLRRL